MPDSFCTNGTFTTKMHVKLSDSGVCWCHLKTFKRSQLERSPPPTMQSKNANTSNLADKTKTYIQLFVIVVQEDKLRVGPRNMLHHQVVAEVADGQGATEEKMLETFNSVQLYTQTCLKEE